MTHIARAIAEIDAAAEKTGLAEFAREADVPYTTAVDWKARGWRPKVVDTFDKFAVAAERLNAPEADDKAGDPS